MRRALATTVTAVAAALSLAACGSPVTGSATAPTTVAAPSTTTAASANTTIEPVPTTIAWPAPTPTTPSYNLPPGYPKVVAVRSLPAQVKNWYQMKGDTQAVQLAPGVWTPLPDGASVGDAVNSGVADGFCASVKAYERTYLGGQTVGGACW